MDEALQAAEFEVVTLDWDGFAAGTSIFTTIFLTRRGTATTTAWATTSARWSMADLFRPGSTTPAASSRRGGSRYWTCSAGGPARPAHNALRLPAPAGGPGPDSLVDVIIEITQYTGLFNAAETHRAAGTPPYRRPACSS